MDSIPNVGDHLIVTHKGSESRWAKKLGIGFSGTVAVVRSVKRAEVGGGGRCMLVVDIIGKQAAVQWPTPNLISRQSGVCCAKCGGMNVEYSCWYKPNTGEAGEMFGSWNAGDNTYCADCDENTDLIDGSAEPEEFLAARAKHGKQIDEDGNVIDTDNQEGSDAR